MKRTGRVVLPLHGGRAPQWLTQRMKRLSREIARLMIDEHGPDWFLQRLSDPYWFQSFGCVLGYDWHSSGVTTVVSGVLKSTLTLEEHGIRAAGGKGKSSRKAPDEILQIGDEMGLSSDRIERLRYASRMCVKIDTAAIQSGYPIYHHTFFVSERGSWCVIQQGLDVEDQTARRYHWLSRHVRSFIAEPHEAIVGETVRDRVLDMTAGESEENRKACVDLVRGDPRNLVSSISRIGSKNETLDRWSGRSDYLPPLREYIMPRRLDWTVFQRLYDRQPRDYEEIVELRGVGPAAVRALALVAALIYGHPASWRDPVKFSFAHGGKDGVPFPVNRPVMDQSITFMREAVESARLGEKDQVHALRRLERLAGRWGL